MKFLRRNVVPTSLVDGLFNKRSGAWNFFPAWKAVLCLLCIQDQSLNNFENNTIKLSVNEAILTGLWARNQLCYYPTGFDFKICLRAQNGPLVYETIFSAHGLNCYYLQILKTTSYNLNRPFLCSELKTIWKEKIAWKTLKSNSRKLS